MKFISKFFYYLIFTVVSIGAIVVITTLVYKGEIIDLLKVEVNKRVKSKLEVNKIDLKLFRGLPNISIGFQGVKFYSALENEILLESENIYFSLNVFELLNQNIVVEKLEIIDAVINIHINKMGEKSFDVFVKNDSSDMSVKTLNLESVFFNNVEINQINELKSINNSYLIGSLQGKLNIDEETLLLGVVSNLRLTRTNQEPFKWLVNKNLKVNLENSIVGDEIKISSSSVAIEQAVLNINGTIGLEGNKKIDLTLNTNNLKFKSLVSVLPQSVQKKLAVYKGSGNIKLNTSIKGNYLGKRRLELKSQIILNEFEVNHKALRFPLKKIKFSAEVGIKDLSDLTSGRLIIEKMSAVIDNKNIEVSAKLQNFIEPNVEGYIKGSLDVSWLLSFVNSQNLKSEGAEGTVELDVFGQLKLSKLFKVESTHFSGNLNFSEVVIANLYGLPLTSLNGHIVFDGNDLSLENLGAKYGQSDMILNGSVTLPKGKDKRLYSKLQVQSNLVNLNEIFHTLTNSTDSVSTSSPVKYSANLDLDVKRLDFLKFNGKDLNVSLSFDEKIINVNTATGSAMGGKIGLQGVMSEQFNGDYYLKFTTQTKHIDLDSLFYVFGNFKQTFITSEAIKGKLDAQIYAYMYFDNDWSFKRHLLYSEAVLRVREGELRNYQPVMSLSTYLHEEGENLAELKFSDLENHIIVSNDTVFISEMYVGTNVRNIKIGGYHTLDQHIDYRLAVPVINDNKDKDTRFGKVKSDKSGKLYFPFRVYGTTSDYKVVYDLKTASSNFIKGLGDVFVGKQKKKIPQDSLELEEDDFFEWDNN